MLIRTSLDVQKRAANGGAEQAQKWLFWLDEKKVEGVAPFKELVQAIHDEATDHSFQQELNRVFFLLSVLIALAAGADYLTQPWPQGSAYFCQLPYFLSIVSFKPFAVPMMYCLTQVAHLTFVEVMFGHSEQHREPSGTLSYSPLPRDPVTVTAAFIVALLFSLWFSAMVVGIAIPALLFAPVLSIPSFILPMVVMYVPSAMIDTVNTSI